MTVSNAVRYARMHNRALVQALASAAECRALKLRGAEREALDYAERSRAAVRWYMRAARGAKSAAAAEAERLAAEAEYDDCDDGHREPEWSGFDSGEPDYHEDSPSLDDHPWSVFRAGERE